ncbi:hypothetical protein WA026_002747 [Henosepilachna vigintioctopunctata]|uniref:Uncharacterized protein n=1 Tax=Henosepilachna vigintioctopunctata TaxID=420089 RepID=A0AAW1U2K7_9CUCU
MNIVNNFQILQCIGYLLRHVQLEYGAIYTELEFDSYPNIPIVSFDTQQTISEKINTKFDIIVLKYINDFSLETSLKKIGSLSPFNANSKYIIVGTKFSSTAVDILYKRYILNVVFIHEKNLNIFSYYPYKNTLNTRTVDKKLHKIGVCGEIKDLFSRKLPKTWNNFTLHLIFHKNTPYAICNNCCKKGIEIEMFEIIGAALGSKMVFSVEANFSTWRIIREESLYDIYFGNLSPLGEDFIFPYIIDALFWFAPSPKSVARWKYIFLIFSWKVYLCCIVCFFAISLIWTMKTSGNRISDFIHIYYLGFKLFFEQGLNLSKYDGRQKYLILLLLFLTFMMGACFKSRFTYMLFGNNFEKGIETFEDILDSGLNVGATPAMALRMNSSTYRIIEYFRTKTVSCDLTMNCLNRVAYSSDIVVAKPELTFLTVRHLYFDEDGRELLKKIEPSFLMYLITARTPRGHPVYDTINKYCQWMVENGIIMKITEKYVWKMVENTSLNLKKLEIEHIKAPVAMWFIGNFFAILAFLAEKYRMR